MGMESFGGDGKFMHDRFRFRHRDVEDVNKASDIQLFGRIMKIFGCLAA
jgi:hypothetical protein